MEEAGFDVDVRDEKNREPKVVPGGGLEATKGVVVGGVTGGVVVIGGTTEGGTTGGASVVKSVGGVTELDSVEID